MAIGGRPQEGGGGNVRDIIIGHLGLPLGQPPDTPRMAVGYVLEARARSI